MIARTMTYNIYSKLGSILIPLESDVMEKDLLTEQSRYQGVFSNILVEEITDRVPYTLDVVAAVKLDGYL